MTNSTLTLNAGEISSSRVRLWWLDCLHTIMTSAIYICAWLPWLFNTDVMTNLPTVDVYAMFVQDQYDTLKIYMHRECLQLKSVSANNWLAFWLPVIWGWGLAIEPLHRVGHSALHLVETKHLHLPFAVLLACCTQKMSREILLSDRKP